MTTTAAPLQGIPDQPQALSHGHLTSASDAILAADVEVKFLDILVVDLVDEGRRSSVDLLLSIEQTGDRHDQRHADRQPRRDVLG